VPADPGPSPCASVVIPVLDGAADLPRLLAALASQDEALEVIAIDSGSRDGSASLIERAGVRLLRVAPGQFDHGETRNLGAREARAEHVLFLSQDALPADPSYARVMREALERDPRLAGVFARQVPRPGADPLTRRDLAAWVAGSATPRTVFVEAGPALATLSPLERHRLTAFDNVASAVRRNVLLQHPFRATRFGEDIEWGPRVLGLGLGIGYVPEAVVIHSHTRAARALFRRNYLCHRALHRLFGLRTIPDRPHLGRALLGALVSDLQTLARGAGTPRQWLAAPLQAAASTYGQYRGARDEAAGRPYPGWA